MQYTVLYEHKRTQYMSKRNCSCRKGATRKSQQKLKWNEMEKELKLKKGFLLYILSFSTLLHNDPAALQDQNFSLTWFSAGLWAEQWIALLIVQNLLLFIALQLSRRGWPRGRQQRTEVSLQYTQETGINETRRMEFFLIFFTICFVFICLF